MYKGYLQSKYKAPSSEQTYNTRTERYDFELRKKTLILILISNPNLSDKTRICGFLCSLPKRMNYYQFLSEEIFHVFEDTICITLSQCPSGLCQTKPSSHSVFPDRSRFPALCSSQPLRSKNSQMQLGKRRSTRVSCLPKLHIDPQTEQVFTLHICTEKKLDTCG